MLFTELTGPQVAALDPDTVAVLPLGAIEQHGPHLPVSTDWVTASSAARAAVEAAGVPAIELPGLAVAKSDEHCRFPGTIWLSWDTLMRTLVDYGESLAMCGLTRLLFVNGHGGNSALGQVACRELRRRFGLRTFFSHLSVPADQGGTTSAPDEYGMGIHGGHGETSLMLHLRPDLVHLELAERRVPEDLRTFRHIGFGKPVSFGWLTDDFGPDGYVGDPTGATAEHGKAVFDAAVGRLVEVIAEARRWPSPS
ncbi:creatininase family protein [Actinomycetospora sp. NBRC 106378]|uniref:creatininase family protein n=1 Tax=Actinomycetospora sp. NBRC 106378 TaxID=3032208 RepID=UPI0024A23F65|nr:creatininase family protein [Actinomycetospora sp. NBRC 106378]GLZ53944.1 creatinine amidohydrolase [Actinomycetospora sp. NBRC 106378]